MTVDNLKVLFGSHNSDCEKSWDLYKLISLVHLLLYEAWYMPSLEKKSKQKKKKHAEKVGK